MLVFNIGELVTLAPLVRENRAIRISNSDLGIVSNAWMLVENGVVKSTGTGTPPQCSERIDASGGLVMPGLVDCHTHPVFGGSRSDEFAMRLDGASYQDIAAKGGGILSTVDHTQKANLEELKAIGRAHINRFLQNGVTTLEAKSGYGLSVESELKLLRAIKALHNEGPQKIIATCLALHAVPRNKSKSEYISESTDILLDKVKQENLAEYVDAFVEEGYFSPEDCEKYIRKAKSLGFKVRIHADEFRDSGAALAAARWGADSADHLEEASTLGIKAMAENGVTAVILPGTSLYCAMKYTKAAPFIEAGVPVALATDFNPGSCRVDNLAFIAGLGALHCGLSVAESVAAVTFVAARCLGLARTKGHLCENADADFLIYDYPNIKHWIADLGQIKPKMVFIAGLNYSK